MRQLSEQKSRELFKLTKEIGLLVLAGIVAQKLVTGSSVSDPLVIIGFAAAFFMYSLSIHFLLRS
jgi:hypothetical protein